MQKRLWITAACLVFGISLLANVPAQLVLPEQSGKLQFVGIGGSIWQGEIKQIRVSGKPLPVHGLNWTVRPTALLRGTLKADFREAQTAANHGQIVFHPLSRQLELQALHWQFPGRALDPWFRAGAGLQGQFALDLQTLRMPLNGLFPRELQGRFDWQNAALRLDADTWPLGAPLMQLYSEGGAIKGIVTNSQPMLPGDSSFQCTPEFCLAELNLRPTPDAPRSLSNALMLLGLQKSGDRYSGQITVPLE